jgi:hypothetical protein
VNITSRSPLRQCVTQFVLIAPMMRDLAVCSDFGDIESLFNIFPVHDFVASSGDDHNLIGLSLSHDRSEVRFD